MLSEKIKFVQVMAPVADFAAGGTSTAVVATGGFHWATFLINMGVNTGTTGSVQPKVYATDDNAKSNSTEIGGWARTGTGSLPGTDAIALTRFEAGASLAIGAANCVATQHLVEVDIEECKKLQEAAGYTFGGIYLGLTETVNDPIVGSVTVVLSESRYQGGAHTATVLA